MAMDGIWWFAAYAALSLIVWIGALTAVIMLKPRLNSTIVTLLIIGALIATGITIDFAVIFNIEHERATLIDWVSSHVLLLIGFMALAIYSRRSLTTIKGRK